MDKNTFTADLHWALSSPNLLSQAPQGLNGAVVSEQRTRQLQENLEFNSDVPSPHRRLGHYFEQLLLYALDNHPQCQLLAHNLAIFERKQQLGALDLLFTQQQELYHWELAVKFYLYYAPEQRWYGPNAQDHLEKKLQRLFNHQLPLAKNPTISAYLQQQQLSQPVHSAALVRGYLFYHWQQSTAPIADWINPQHNRGWWCFQHELFAKLAERPEHHRWQILPRMDWLRPACIPLDPAPLTRHDIFNAISAQIAPPLVVELQKKDAFWIELSRGFVVPDQWPRCNSLQS